MSGKPRVYGKYFQVIVATLLLVGSVGCGATEEDDYSGQVGISGPGQAGFISSYSDEDYYSPDFDGDLRKAVYTEMDDSDADAEEDADSFTLMVYICGSDLESDDGCATADLTEMMYGESGENLNIVVETGGCSEWQNNVISADSLERYLVTGDGLEKVGDAGDNCITDYRQLTDFVKFAASEYPADRYGFIFWDHGGGTLYGYGSDENYDDASMSLEKMAKGFKDAGVHFDFVGFDCCLMGTMETGYSLKDTADYMIASEESEPETGWYYTNFVSMLEQDPGASVKSIGKQIIDDYCSDEYTYTYSDMMLSLVDLSKIDAVVDNLDNFFKASDEYLRDGGYNELSQARNGAKSYGEDDFEQIDMLDYVSRLDMTGKDELTAAVQDAVLYNGTNVEGSNGLAMFYPYLYIEDYPDYSKTIENIGISAENYYNFFNDFVSLEATGQSVGGNSHPFAGETGGSTSGNVFHQDWYDDDLADEYAGYYTELTQDEDLEIVDKDGVYVLSLSDEAWETITDVGMQVYIDDGEGYLALGEDDAVFYDEDGDLIVDYDYTWLYMNDCLISYQPLRTEESADGKTYYIGTTLACLNDEEYIDIYIRWDGDKATVLGYLPEESWGVAARGYNRFKNGDIIDFIFDYYSYDDDYIDAYTLEDNSIVFDKSVGFTVEYQDIGDCDTEVYCHLRDTYQNDYWTETLVYSMDW